MLVIINCILALIFFFVFFIMLHSELHSEPSFIKLAIVLTALLINIVCVVTIISSFKYTMIDIKLSDEVKSSQNIVNFKDNRDLQGGFFIGCGEVNTEQYYYYYYKTDKGSYKASKIKADDCEIIYTKDTPHIDTIVKSADEKATENPLTFEPLLSLRISGTGEKYKIYIPEGSITTDFQVDMEWAEKNMLFIVLTFIFLLISILLSIYGLLFTSPKWLSTLAVTSIIMFGVCLASTIACCIYSQSITKNLKLESVIEIQPIKSTYNTTYFVEDSHYYCFNTKKDTLRINKSTCNINYTDTNARIEKYVNKPDESQLIPIFYISFNDEYTLGDEYYYKIYVPLFRWGV